MRSPWTGRTSFGAARRGQRGTQVRRERRPPAARPRPSSSRSCRSRCRRRPPARASRAGGAEPRRAPPGGRAVQLPSAPGAARGPGRSPPCAAPAPRPARHTARARPAPARPGPGSGQQRQPGEERSPPALLGGGGGCAASSEELLCQLLGARRPLGARVLCWVSPRVRGAPIMVPGSGTGRTGSNGEKVKTRQNCTQKGNTSRDWLIEEDTNSACFWWHRGGVTSAPLSF